MSPFRDITAFVFLALLAPEGLALLSAPKKHKAHHRHHRHHQYYKALNSSSEDSTLVVAQAQSSKTDTEAKFGLIQNKLVKAWKHKVHMAKLRKTLKEANDLLMSQESLMKSEVDDEISNSAARKQASETENMIKDARHMLNRSREDALKKTHEALKEAYSVRDQTKLDIEASSAAIAKATKAKQDAEKKIEKIDSIIHAATEEAKFFFHQQTSVGHEKEAKDVKDVKDVKASTKSSSAQTKDDSAQEGDEEEHVGEAKNKATLPKNEEPPKSQPKQAEHKQQAQKKDDSAHESDEEEPIKQANEKVTLAMTKKPSESQSKQADSHSQLAAQHFVTLPSKGDSLKPWQVRLAKEGNHQEPHRQRLKLVQLKQQIQKRDDFEKEGDEEEEEKDERALDDEDK